MGRHLPTRLSIVATAATVAFVLLHLSGATRAQQPVRSTAAESRARIWFVQASGNGDGSSAARPLGTMAQLETVSGAGDVILLLPSDRALDGGLALKPGQALIGLPEGLRLPAITNSKPSETGAMASSSQTAPGSGTCAWRIHMPAACMAPMLRRGIGWIDAHLLASALVGRLRLWTTDPSLATAAKKLGIASIAAGADLFAARGNTPP